MHEISIVSPRLALNCRTNIFPPHTWRQRLSGFSLTFQGWSPPVPPGRCCCWWPCCPGWAWWETWGRSPGWSPRTEPCGSCTVRLPSPPQSYSVGTCAQCGDKNNTFGIIFFLSNKSRKDNMGQREWNGMNLKYRWDLRRALITFDVGGVNYTKKTKRRAQLVCGGHVVAKASPCPFDLVPPVNPSWMSDSVNPRDRWWKASPRNNLSPLLSDGSITFNAAWPVFYGLILLCGEGKHNCLRDYGLCLDADKREC